MIYLDNAATSWPKPPGLSEAVAAAFEIPRATPAAAPTERE